ncbi:MAG: hypothetical protein IPK62_17040 [Bacteroidetes bacterium]|nr:hypothetical protein [Bacteroidota bacterium]
MNLCIASCAGTPFAQFSTTGCPTPNEPRNTCIKALILISCTISISTLITLTPAVLATTLNTAYLAGTVSLIKNIKDLEIAEPEYSVVSLSDCIPDFNNFVSQKITFMQQENENINGTGVATPHFDQIRTWAIRKKVGRLNFGYITCSNELFLNLNAFDQQNTATAQFANATFNVWTGTQNEKVGGKKICKKTYNWTFTFDQPFLENLPRITDISVLPANPFLTAALS